MSQNYDCQNKIKYIEIDGSSDEEEMEESELKKDDSYNLEIDFWEILDSESKVTVDLKTLIKEESIKIEQVDNVPEAIGIEEAARKVSENEGIHNIQVSHIVSKATVPTPPVMKPVISKEGLVTWVQETFEGRDKNITTGRKENLDNIFELCDMEEKEKLFGCLRTECAERFKSRNELKAHLAGQHRHKGFAKEKKKHKSSNMCKECGKKFFSPQVLKRHTEMVHAKPWARAPYSTLVRLCPECVNPAESCTCEAAREVKQPEHNKDDHKFKFTNSAIHHISSETNVSRSTSEVLAELIDIFQ